LSNISEPLAAFLQQRLPSIEQVEIVLLLRSDRTRAWSAAEVAQALEMPPESAAMRLFLLASAGLILFEAAGMPKYRYAGSDEATEALLDELSDQYQKDRAAVASAVGAPPDPIRSFADAFKLKK
jgi:hypothetical protein